ncbi:MAG: nicotinate-nucleotide adenylyltransferase [Metamycoplasmataceae bacterium]
MKIGLFGGSFNPITKAHLEIAEETIKELNLDFLYFIPANINVNKKKIKLVDGNQRIKMIELVLKDKMKVSDFELKRKGISYTYKTIEYFKNKFPLAELFFIIGNDNLKNLNDWKNIDYISENCKIVVCKRGEWKKHINFKKYNCLLIEKGFDPISSSSFIRGNFNFVDKKVRKYIFDNFLYWEQILENTLTQERFNHCKNTALFATELSKILNINPKEAYYGGLLHDITKQWTEEKARAFLAKYNFDENIPKYMLHQETAFVLLTKIFGADNNNIIVNAIRKHTSLDLELNDFDKMIFMADKICKGRRWEGIQEIRKEAFLNFNDSFLKIVKITNEFNINKGITFTKEQQKIYDKWS